MGKYDYIKEIESLAVILQFVCKNHEEALASAKILLKYYGSVIKILNSKKEDLILSVDDNIADYIIKIQNIFKYKKLQYKSKCKSIDEAITFYKKNIGFNNYEMFVCIFIGTHMSILGNEIMFEGTVDKVHIYTREIVKKMLCYNATGVIVMHNHPSQLAEPSEQDQEITNSIKVCLKNMGSVLYDHIIVTHNHHYSFAQNGLI